MIDEIKEIEYIALRNLILDFINEQNDINLKTLVQFADFKKCSNCEQWELIENLESPEANSEIGDWCENCRNDK